jgi:alkanesulfonate monooxygenase SsuD/methylene tetrahydromethanopterin reductase-like flavin-dependent oxidoreductase (luciferase family)
MYLQDTWKVTRKLNINLGLRYEVNSVIKEDHNLLGNFDPTKGLVQAGAATGNVFAADTDEEARLLFTSLQQAFVNLRRGMPGRLPPPIAGFEDRLTPAERGLLAQALSSAAVGSRDTVRHGIDTFVARTGADELIITSQIFDHTARLKSFEITSSLA